MGRKRKDFNVEIGDEFFKWTAISKPFKKNGRYVVTCQCSCSGKTMRDILLSDLRYGKSKTCGCYRITHGLTNHKLYLKFKCIKDRCYNPNHIAYGYYGGRGIKVCDEWLRDFELFYNWAIDNGWDDSLEIDRKDNDGSYEPDNCRFVTHQTNMLNQSLRITNNSGFRGVYYSKACENYYCQIIYNGKVILDRKGFKTAKQAAIYRDSFIVDNKLPHKLNFNKHIGTIEVDEEVYKRWNSIEEKK